MKGTTELAQELGIHRDTLVKAWHKQRIPGEKIGGRDLVIDDEDPLFQVWLRGENQSPRGKKRGFKTRRLSGER